MSYVQVNFLTVIIAAIPTTLQTLSSEVGVQPTPPFRGQST